MRASVFRHRQAVIDGPVRSSGRRTVKAIVGALVLLTTVGVFPVTNAPAAFPGRNGKIAFVKSDGSDLEIYTIKAGGGGVRRVTDNSVDDFGPDWQRR